MAVLCQKFYINYLIISLYPRGWIFCCFLKDEETGSEKPVSSRPTEHGSV